MKKLLLLPLLFIGVFIFGQGTPFPGYQQMTNSTTKLQIMGGVQATKGLINGTFTDTATANSSTYIDFYAGAQIYTTNDNRLWVRNAAATRWTVMGSGITISNITMLTDSSMIICYSDGVCDTISFNNNNVFMTVSNTFGGCNNLLSGGVVTAANPTVNLIFDVTAANYTIGCRPYNTPLSQVTLANGDATFGRFDVVAVDTNEAVIVIQGTPSSDPQVPQINPASQLALTTILVPAGATTATQLGITKKEIYNENLQYAGGEFNTAASGWTTDFNNTSFPYNLTKDAFVSGGTISTSQLTFTTLDTLRNGQYDVFKFYIRLTNQWVTGLGFDIAFYNGTTKVSNSVIFTNNSYGFDQTVTGSYQTIAIPMANWVFTDSIFFKLVIKPLATPFVAQAFRLDWIQLQGGINQALGGSSGLYIWNQYSLAQPANWWIAGAAKVQGGITSPNVNYYLSEKYGLNAIANGVAATAVGAYATVTGSGGTALGDETVSTGGIAIGYYARSGGSTNISIGGTTASATSSNLLGINGTITGNQSFGTGESVTVAHNNSFVFGYFGASTATGQFVVGSDLGANPTNSFYLGSVGVSGTNATDVTWRISGESGTNQAGHALTIGSGLGTGNAAVTVPVINLQTPTAVASGTTIQTYTTRATINSSGILVPNGIMPTSGSGGTDSVVARNSSTGQFYLTEAASGGLLFARDDAANASGGGLYFDNDGEVFEIDNVSVMQFRNTEFSVNNLSGGAQRFYVSPTQTILYSTDNDGKLTVDNSEIELRHIGGKIEIVSIDGGNSASINLNNASGNIDLLGTGKISLSGASVYASIIPYNSGAGIVALGIDTVAVSPTFGQIVRKTASAGTTYTSSNGITLTGSNFKLGGTLVENTDIDADAFTLNLNSATSTKVLEVENDGTGYAIRATSVDGVGVFAYSQSSWPLYIQNAPTATNTVTALIKAEKLVSGGAGANGVGGSIDFYIEADAGGSGAIANQIISKWTTATLASRTSEFSITGVNSATTRTLMTLGGAGLMTLGVTGTNTGSLAFAGVTSGLITIQPASAAGTYTLTLPTTDGDASQVLTTDGSGVLSWTTVSAGSSTWNGITDPTGDQALTFGAGESSTWTDQNTTEDLFTVNNATQTTSSMFSFNRTTTAIAAGNNIMELVSSGANGTGSMTSTTLRISNTNTGTTSTNDGIHITASGATTNNAITVAAGRTILPAGTASANAQSLYIGSTGLYDVSGLGVGAYFGAGSGYQLFMGQSGVLFGQNTAVIDFGQAGTFGTTNRIRMSATAEGTVKFHSLGLTAATVINGTGGENTAASLALVADEGDDAADTWTISSTTANLLTFTNTAQALSLSTSGSLWSVRDVWKQGADVASAVGAIALGTDGNSFEITGTSAITLISNLNYQNGAVVTLIFTSTASLTDGTANSGTDIGMELAGNANFTGSAGATITLLLSEIGGTQRWREMSRSVQ